MRKPENCACGKVFYWKETQAVAYAKEHSLKYNKGHRVYKCTWCPYYCLTTKFRKKKDIEQAPDDVQK